jgi:uridine kinase
MPAKAKSALKVTWEELYEMEIVKKARAWNRMRDVDTIEGINRRMRFGGYREVIRDADRAYGGAIWKAAAEILENRDRIRIVIVAGPSSSGKTTTTIKLCEALKAMGDNLQLLSMDNYFWNLKDQPRDEFGDHNFETPEALDKQTINRNLTDLLSGAEADIPIYNFKTGRREAKGRRMLLPPGQLLVIEGLHALHSDMTEGIDPRSQFRVYIEAICQLKDGQGSFIPWTDIRLFRRMVRDNLHRNYPPLKTIGHWHYVRKAEKAHKKYLYQSLKDAVEHFGDARGREDALKRASRCLSYLEAVDVLEDESIIPPTSLLREFIGGSAYKY